MKYFNLMTLMLCLSCLEAADNKRPADQEDGERGETTITTPVTATAANVKSQAFRVQGKTQLTYEQMTKNLAIGKVDDYSRIPNPNTDNDENIIKYKESSSVACGVLETLESVSEREKDCEEKLSIENSTWNGATNGISGEGNFVMVMKKDSKKIWRDETTGLLWSYRITEDDWESASGNYGDSRTEDFTCNQITGFNEGEVSWRLPTRSEFLQADINGARFVLEDLANTYWTATSVNKAGIVWAINQEEALLEKKHRDEKLSIRCVGHIVKD